MEQYSQVFSGNWNHPQIRYFPRAIAVTYRVQMVNLLECVTNYIHGTKYIIAFYLVNGVYQLISSVNTTLLR